MNYGKINNAESSMPFNHFTLRRIYLQLAIMAAVFLVVLLTPAAAGRGHHAAAGACRGEERKRIARDIHDELGQMLTALRMKFGQDNPALLSEVQNFMGRVDATIQVVRNVAAKLRPEHRGRRHLSG